MRERLIVGGGALVSGFDLLGYGTPTATLASEMQPAEKGRMTSLSILCLILNFLGDNINILELELELAIKNMQPLYLDLTSTI